MNTFSQQYAFFNDKVTNVNNNGLPPLYYIDGLCLTDSGIIKKINLNLKEVKNIHFSRNSDTVFTPDHKPVFYGVIYIKTKAKYNKGLKHITKSTKDWLKEHPFTQIIVDGKPFTDDLTKYTVLSSLCKENIKTIDIIKEKIGESKYDATLIIVTK